MMINFLDCTLRDGGYYNAWDFEPDLVASYFEAMVALDIGFVEVGFRSFKNQCFKGGFAYSTDRFLQSLSIPSELDNKIAVMVNASDLVAEESDQVEVLEKLFSPKSQSPVSLVRIACHIHEFSAALPAAEWLKEQGYLVGFNLMQIADRTDDEIISLAKLAYNYPIDVLYFADSMGSLNPVQVKHIVSLIRKGWPGAIGIHAHDNMSQALANSIMAVESGVAWVDSTVTGMGRGPGNTQTEYLVLALAAYCHQQANITKLLELIRRYFRPMQTHYGWGTNPYYYLAGQYGIHPSYIQEMQQDARYSDEDVIAVIDHLRVEGGKKFSLDTLEASRYFYSGELKGVWKPRSVLKGREVLVVGSGPSVQKYKTAIENYIHCFKPYVIALNTEASLQQELIDARAACHPVRLLADCHQHLNLVQPLITPYSMLPKDVQFELESKEVFDFGLLVEPGNFVCAEQSCILPNSLVISYVLAIANSGCASAIRLVGFDGYSLDDTRTVEMEQVFQLYQQFSRIPLCSLTPTRYNVPTKSIFGF